LIEERGMGFASHYLSCAGRELHYTEWGAQHDEVIIAWHGLARTCRDMDDIAAHLSQRYRVICPDTLGRGLSQWAADPSREYCLAFYVQLAVALVDQLGLERFHWLGTSMGGATGTKAAAGPLRGRIRRLVLNDNGPQLAATAIERIRSYAGSPTAFATVSELEQYFRTVYKPYGWLSDAQWRRLTETSTRLLPDGRVTPHYDPAMVRQFIDHPNDYDLWAEWDTLELPVLCLRGVDSDLLLRQTAEGMRQRGPRAVVVEIAGCGHAPALNTPEQFALVERFLSA
jgi:pimeloyl-ACP methyl ester carboxylesterase